ncbi:hypothetical protein SHL15_5014 [Streptomyces hygroscopicus subsp. limoneus]|nr:hypothetical protein SHL15_5014 [Streptomyces hygroscopicus subsp. limoneus]
MCHSMSRAAKGSSAPTWSTRPCKPSASPAGQLPAPLFRPQVVTDTSAKPSRSLIREGRAPSLADAADWMLDTRQWPGTVPEYAEQPLSLTDTLLSDRRHFFRAYSASEIGRLMTAPATRSVPAP